MNIFFTSSNPYTCAIALDDKRLNKMILETAQLLSGAVHAFIEAGDNKLTPEQHSVLYKRTHFNHPSAKFARSTLVVDLLETPTAASAIQPAKRANFTWLYDHFVHLVNEKKMRTNKLHLSYIKLAHIFILYTVDTTLHTLTNNDIAPYIACDQDLKDSVADNLLTPFEAYRIHMQRKWLSDAAPTWTKSCPPDWAVDLLPHAIIKE